MTTIACMIIVVSDCQATYGILQENVKPHHLQWTFPDSKVHEANMGPTWVLSAPDGPHVGHMNLAIRVMVGEVWQLSKDDVKLPADQHGICTQLWLDGLDNMNKFKHHCYGMIIICYNLGTNLFTFAPGLTLYNVGYFYVVLLYALYLVTPSFQEYSRASLQLPLY